MSPRSQTQKKACKIRSYLNSQKRTALVGPPPTQTTKLLQSLLDGDKGKKRNGKSRNVNICESEIVHKSTIGRRRNKGGSAKGNNNEVEKSKSRCDGSGQIDVWTSDVNLQSIGLKQNSNDEIFSNGTLADVTEKTTTVTKMRLTSTIKSSIVSTKQMNVHAAGKIGKKNSVILFELFTKINTNRASNPHTQKMSL